MLTWEDERRTVYIEGKKSDSEERRKKYSFGILSRRGYKETEMRIGLFSFSFFLFSFMGKRSEKLFSGAGDHFVIQ